MASANRNNNMQLSDLPAEQMRALLREMADFIALYETIEEKLIAREIALESKLMVAEKSLAEQLAKVKTSLADFQSIMTEAGAARWRIAAETALKDGNQHLQALYETTTEISQTLKENSEYLEKVANQTVMGIGEAAQSFQVDHFKEAAAAGCEQIKDISISASHSIQRLTKVFQWKNLAMSFVLTLIVVFLTGLYLDDEWPWEAHEQASKERSAGQTLLNAWSHLTPSEQQDILNSSKKH